MKLASAFYMQLDNNMVYLLLGSNLGDRASLLKQAVIEIGNRIGQVQYQSSLYETAAWGKKDQPKFLNQAVGVQTVLSPLEVLDQVLWIEKELGRVRHEKWGSRLIDIDIILYNNEIIDVKNRLQVPHPEMQNRRFVLEPLTEIAGDVSHPVLNKTIKEILMDLKDTLEVSKIINV